jgi:membrane protease subunit HflK
MHQILAPPPETTPPPAAPPPALVLWRARPDPGRLLFGLLGLWMLTGIYIVPADQQAVVTRFGAVVEPRVKPGIHVSLPWPLDRVSRLKVQQLQRVVIGGDFAEESLGRTQPHLSQFLTGDQNIIHVRAVVQYSVADPVDYLFRAREVTDIVRAAAEAELARRVARREVDDVITTGKTGIQNEVRTAAQRLLDEYRLGVVLSTVNIESVAAPAESADAFRAVASARADAARIVNEAQGYASGLVPKARGEAAQMREQAEAFRLSRINEAQGDAARFTAVAAEYDKAPDVTAGRLYVEAMEQILPRIKKLIVDPNGNLDLSIIRRGEKP